MKPSPKTIQFFLPSGNPQGIKIVQVTSRIPLAIYIPRTELAQACKRDELLRAGIYFLFGDADDINKTVYIGESENCLERLKQHNTGNKEWNSAVAIVSKTNELTKSHIRYLEWLCCQEAGRIGKVNLQNILRPTDKPFVTEPMQADLMEMFETIALLLSMLDYPIFEEVHLPKSDHVMYCKGPKATAKGMKVPDGFLVFKNSLATSTSTPSLGPSLIGARQQLTLANILRPQGEHFVFVTDYTFPSPSQAAGVILGRKANGWTEWKNDKGQTLDEMLRNDIEDQTDLAAVLQNRA